MSTETERNEWVAATLGYGPVYRDDNCFVLLNDEEGQTLAYISIIDARGEVLLHGSASYPVPRHLWLGIAQ
jgi:hypothetical protein